LKVMKEKKGGKKGEYGGLLRQACKRHPRFIFEGSKKKKKNKKEKVSSEEKQSQETKGVAADDAKVFTMLSKCPPAICSRWRLRGKKGNINKKGARERCGPKSKKRGGEPGAGVFFRRKPRR